MHSSSLRYAYHQQIEFMSCYRVFNAWVHIILKDLLHPIISYLHVHVKSLHFTHLLENVWWVNAKFCEQKDEVFYFRILLLTHPQGEVAHLQNHFPCMISVVLYLFLHKIALDRKMSLDCTEPVHQSSDLAQVIVEWSWENFGSF